MTKAGAAKVALVGMVLCSLWIVLEAASKPNPVEVPASIGGFGGWVAGPLRGAGISPDRYRLAWILVGMSLLYLVVLWCGRHVSRRWAIGTIVALVVIYVLGPTILSRDAFTYVFYGRMGILHDASPYAVRPAEITDDPFLKYLCCRDIISPYGPLFVLANYALVPLGFAAALWFWKVMAGIAALAAVRFTWTICEERNVDPVPAILFVGLNPLLLAYAVGGAHLDLLLLPLLLGGVLLAVRGREAWGTGTVVAAVGAKITAGAVLPFMILGARDRVAALRAAALALVAVAVVSVAALGTDVANLFESLQDHADEHHHESIPSALAALAGKPKAWGVTSVAATLIFVAWFGWLLKRTWDGEDWIRMAGWGTFALLVTAPWLLPWYVVLLLPFAAIGDDRRLQFWTIALCTYQLLQRMTEFWGMGVP